MTAAAATTTTSSSSTTTQYTMAMWLVRLHLAQYLVTGKFPTILHRILRLELRNDTTTGATPSSSRRVVFQPNINRIIAGLILLQASGTLVGTACNWFARRTADLLLLLLYRSSRSSISSSSSSAAKNTTGLQIEDESQYFIGNKLSEYFSAGEEDRDEDRNSVVVKNGDTFTYKNGSGNNNSTTTTCAICRTDRKHPAASISCGHVCCWKCLNQWVTNVRPECPLCRSPCRPQNILALYHYEQT
jgi:hypothetical protein